MDLGDTTMFWCQSKKTIEIVWIVIVLKGTWDSVNIYRSLDVLVGNFIAIRSKKYKCLFLPEEN